VKRWIPAACVAALVFAGFWLARSSSRRSAEAVAQAQLASSSVPVPQREHRLEAAALQLKEDPENIQALLESGRLHYEKGKEFYPDAINELEEAWRLGALDPMTFYYLGVMYQEEGLYSFAISQYKRFLRNKPDDLEIRLLLAKLLYQNGQYDEALTHYAWAQSHGSKDPVVRENMGLCLVALKRTDEASKIFQELSQRGSAEGKRADFYLGQIASDGLRYQEAIDLFSKALPLGNEDIGIPPAVLHAALAVDLQKLERWDSAKAEWEKALGYDPSDKKAKRQLGVVKAAIRKAERAAKRRSSRRRG